MEVYAGFMAHTDHHVGRLIDTIDELGVLDDTLVFYIVGDNGASAEGTVNGTFNELLMLNGASALETVEFMTSKVDLFGGPEAYNHYAVGWAHAMDTPVPVDQAGRLALGWHPQRHDRALAQRVHGTWRDPVAVQPRDRRRPDDPRSRQPAGADVRARRATDAASRARAWCTRSTTPTSPERHELQYFEMFVNRGIYHQGWTACTRHTTPWVVAPTPPLDDDVWELYGPDDWTQARNIADQNPAKLAELQRLFLIEATKYNVLPLDDRRVERFNADIAGRPQLIHGNTQLLFGGMGRLSENSVIVIKNKSHAVTANITVPDGGADGRDHRPRRRVRRLEPLHQGRQAQVLLQHVRDHELPRSRVTACSPPGDHQMRMEFAYDGGGLGKGGNVTLYVDGDKVGEGRVEATVPMVFSGDETTDVGRDTGTGVSPDYATADNEFTGRIHWVQIDIDENAEDLDHLITAEERFRIAMARQ